jgi:radical SAM superfamily enzyme YgiQ (UPF0313 family)
MNKISPRVCIYLADLVHTHAPGNYVVPLNVANIAGCLIKEYGNDVETRLFKNPETLIQAIENKQPDILGLSNYFWNNELNMAIGSDVARKFPKIFIIMGGPSIRTAPEGIKSFLKQREFLDSYILFEGEKPFVRLIYKFLQDAGIPIDSCLKEINGCASLSSQGDLIYTPPEILKDLSDFPSPYLNGLLDEFLLDGLIPLFESNRGCPFSCTFCTWGIGALKKVRKFPLDRIFNEMEYVARLVPKSPFWIFADANFGIFSRDVEIAKHIGEIKAENPSLSRVTIWTSKNKPERNKEIACLMGNLERPLIAVQTWDPVVQKNIKRNNIKQESALNLVLEIKQEGMEVATDVLCGLPGETYESHLKTLRMAFDVGFDFIDVGNVVMLPGSELENNESRDKFGLRTKYRVRQGSYGEYNGIKAIEYEEIIRATTSFNENKMIRCRLLHWLIWLSWNAGFLKPLLLFLHRESKVNPLDFILKIMDEDKTGFPRIKKYFEKFLKESRDEWFGNIKELQAFYFEINNWQRLLTEGFAKMNFSYTTELILCHELRGEFYGFLYNIAKKMTSSNILQEIFLISRENHISPRDIFENNTISEKKYHVLQETISYFLPSSVTKRDGITNSCSIMLKPDDSKVETIRSYLIKCGFMTNQRHAVQKTLEPFMKAFQYDLSYSINH